MKELNALERSAKWNADNFEPVTVAGTKEIIAIAEAFRALEQENILLKQGCENNPLVHEMIDWKERAEAAEADNRNYSELLSYHIDRQVKAEAKLAELEKQEPIYQYMTVSMLDETCLEERWHDCSKERFDEANSELEGARIVYRQQQPIIADGLHPDTADLVITFAEALARKLRRSEEKYGWSDGWKDSDWKEKCLADFHHHISKGDPLDVAAYCAFMVHHGWKTRPAPAVSLAPVSNCLSFFASVIKSGESWSATCQRDLDAARAILRNIQGQSQ